MAGIADALKQLMDIPASLASGLTSAASTPGSFATAATESAEALQSIAQKIKAGVIEEKIDRALTAAETWVVVTGVAQVVMAAALIGLFMASSGKCGRARPAKKGRRR
jgi:hypothetical protein